MLPLGFDLRTLFDFYQGPIVVTKNRLAVEEKMAFKFGFSRLPSSCDPLE